MDETENRKMNVDHARGVLVIRVEFSEVTRRAFARRSYGWN